LNDYKKIVYNAAMISLDQLITFKLVVDHRSFSQAAEKLALTAAAVGKQIKNLEDMLGAQLLYRTTRHVSLTELGEAFYAQCESILKEVEQVNDIVATYKGEITGKLKIVSGIFFAESYIIPHLATFMALYPKIILEIELADRVPNIEAENIDLLIGLMAGLPTHYMCRKLKDDRYVFCASPAYIKKYGAPQKPMDLMEHHFITHSRRPQPTVITWNDELSVHVNPVLWINSTNAMLQCCLDGLGIAMLHSDVVSPYLKKKELLEVLINYRQSPQPLYMYFKKMQYMQPKLRVFIDFFMKILKSK